MTGENLPVINFFPESRPIQISLGDDFACTLLENGTVYCKKLLYFISIFNLTLKVGEIQEALDTIRIIWNLI